MPDTDKPEKCSLLWSQIVTVVKAVCPSACKSLVLHAQTASFAIKSVIKKVWSGTLVLTTLYHYHSQFQAHGVVTMHAYREVWYISFAGGGEVCKPTGVVAMERGDFIII